MSEIGILVVDDQEGVRRGIRSLLASRPDWTVCGEARDGVEATELARQLHPSIVLMDVSMPHMDGIEATRAIRRDLPDSDVIIVSQNDPLLAARQAREAGAFGYVSKSNLSRDLIRSIDAALAARTVRPGRSETATAQPFVIDDLAKSEMARLIWNKDWAQTPVGSPETWSPALRMMVNLLLANRFPLLLWWGPEYIQFYNDAYKPIPGAKHPNCLGQSGSKCWSEIWHILKPLVDTPFNGGPATWSEDLELVIYRSESLEETHFTIAYSPVPDSAAPRGIGGVLATVHEITEKVIGERRVALLRELASRSTEGRTAEEACSLASEAMAHYPKDVPFALVYLLDTERKQAHLAAAAGIEDSVDVDRVIDVNEGAEGDLSTQFAAGLHENRVMEVEKIGLRLRQVPPGPWPDPPERAVVVPIPSNKPHESRGLLVLGVSVRLTLNDDYRTFFLLIAAQLGTAIANAEAYEEERKRAEALAEIDRAKTLFFSNVSHEFRTPLTLMLGPLEDSLSAADGLTDQHREHVLVAHRNSLRLLKLVNTLLDFSRIEAGRIEACYQPTDLPQLTAELASVFRSAIERAGLKLIINCPEFDQPVYVDREMWEKIVFNLLSNALKFTFSGEIEVALTKAGSSVELSVRDTGTGIPADELSHLFERFYRVKGAHGRTFEGSGIGLALVQELAKLHGGSVRVESKITGGSTFTVKMPLGSGHLPADRISAERTLAPTELTGEAYVQEALRWIPGSQDSTEEPPVASSLSPTEISPPQTKTGENRARILLADDNADMREYLQRLLLGRYEVIAVGDGSAALESARKQAPDLVLADVMMPRLDGFGLLRELRADRNLTTVPVILVSARAGEESRIEGLRAGADDYLVKPFSARELLARVDAHLELARVRRQVARSEERFRALVNASSYVVYRMNSDWSEMWHLDGRGVISDTAKPRRDWMQEYIHPDDQALVLQAIREAVRNKGMFELEHRIRRIDGSIGWTYSRAVPLLDAQGQIVEWFGAASDVTARKEAEEKYRKLAESLDAEVRARTRELETRNVDVVRQSEQLRDLSQRLLRTQDEERRHIARELHDSAGQTLTVLGMNLAQLAYDIERPTPQTLKQVESAQDLVQQLHKEIRTTSYLLHPPLLDESGLASALAWYTEGLTQRSGLEIQLSIPEDFVRIPRDMELVVFRLVQECLTNIHRHSGARNALIRVARVNENLCVDVEDDGKGMSPDKLAEIQAGGFGLGIRGMRERIRPLHGNMNIESAPSGTHVSVVIPLPQLAETDPDTEPIKAAVQPSTAA